MTLKMKEILNNVRTIFILTIEYYFVMIFEYIFKVVFISTLEF